MEKMSKEQIENIGKSILSESDVVALHGTSIENGLSILETGFNFTRTSMVICDSDDVISLCTYGWKEIEAGQAANIIISIPKKFYKALLNYNDESYTAWIKNVKENDLQQKLIESVADFNFNGPVFKATVPREFIRGMFVYTDNKNYLSFLNNKEEGMNYLTYIDNQHYFMNLSNEEKEVFIENMKNKLFPQEQSQHLR